MSEVPLARAAWTSSDESRTCLLCPALRDRGGWDTSERECLARQDLEPESASLGSSQTPGGGGHSLGGGA